MNDIYSYKHWIFFYLYDNHYTLIEIYLEQYYTLWGLSEYKDVVLPV